MKVGTNVCSVRGEWEKGEDGEEWGKDGQFTSN